MSFNRALNLREPGENAGGWYLKVLFFSFADEPPKVASPAGEGTEVGTTPSLGELGVHYMSGELARENVKSTGEEITNLGSRG